MKISNQKKNRRQAAYRKTAAAIKARPCSNCGQPGPHFAPPGFGSPGFFTCAPTEGESTQ